MLRSLSRWGGVLLFLFGVLASAPASDNAAALVPAPGTTVAVIGNTFADRMQHSAWFDTMLHTRFPDKKLRVRHLGFSADEIGGFGSKPDFNKRLRSADFGSNDEWLTRVKADWIVACFGYNESFGGEEGLPKFKEQLADFITHSKKQKYNGTSAPQVVLVGPIAHENLKNLNLPDGSKNNPRIALYSKAMADVAAANSVPYVDLYNPTSAAYPKAKTPLTINGIHLTDDGYRQVAEMIDTQLFGKPIRRDEKLVEAVHTAAVDRNFHWNQRYRTTDGYSVYGGRSHLVFEPEKQTNRTVAQREMQILDEMTAFRDDHVNAIAQGSSAPIDDTKTAEFIKVISNKPGKGPEGKHIFASGEASINSMTLGKNLKVNLFADEATFPGLLVNPMQMTWDQRGRLWVICWHSYPHWKPKDPLNDKILILEDTNGDGKADKCTVFADGLNNPTGFEFVPGGVLVAQCPDIWLLKDTNGDDKADTRERVLSGLDSADTHHGSNSFVVGPGGDVFFQEGTFHHSQVETPYGPPERNVNGGVYRYDPRTMKFEVYVTYGFANPHGHVFDKWGNDIVIDGTGANPYHAALFSSYLPYPMKHGRTPQVYQQRTRPCGGMEFLSSSHFPEDYRGTLAVTNCIGVQGVLRYKIEDNGATLRGSELEPMLLSTDPNFRPVDAKVGPDGALYIADWQNPIIGHMQHNLRDPNRDREHGRIYRLSYEGRETTKLPKIAGESVASLLELLKSKDDRVRHWAKIELSSRETKDVIPAVQSWVEGLKAEESHALTEALWVHQSHNVANVKLLDKVLADKDPNARAAALRVLSYWKDRVPNALGMTRTFAADENPRVRLMAVWASSFIRKPEAMEAALIAKEQPKDAAVDVVINETIRGMTPLIQDAIARKEPVKFATPVGAKYFTKLLGNDDLLKLPRTTEINDELMLRPNLRDEVRRDVVAQLAKARTVPESKVMLDAIKAIDNPTSLNEAVAFDLVRLLTERKADLPGLKAEFEKLAGGANTALVRQLGFVALATSTTKPADVYSFAKGKSSSLSDFVSAVPLLRDPLQRTDLYPQLLPLLSGFPKELQAGTNGKDLKGRYVRIELPGNQRTLTLAEVQVFSNGRNVALGGTAKQSSTDFNGPASKAIDGNTSGKFTDGGQTHSKVGEKDPWWELDLGKEMPIERIVLWNRTDAEHDARFRNYTLVVKGDDKKTVFELKNQPQPAGASVTHRVSPENPESLFRRNVMLALTSVRGKETESFTTIAKYVGNETDRVGAITALLRIPQNSWPADQAAPLLKQITGYVEKVPQAERTTPAVLEALQFADSLTTLLPKDDAKKARKALGELGVRVIRVGTITDQMLFDKDRIVVQAGKPVEFVFDNTDIMPHNFVIIEPGQLQDIGDAAENFATSPDAMAKQFIPPGKKFLLASKLLQPQTSQTIRYTAPAKPGVYPYVCTYPGHWRRMHGALYVVADMDEYLADPEKYIAANKIAPTDELLKFNRPRTEWKLEDLTPALAELDKGGRNFARGKQMFSVGTCISCHKFDNGGQEFGPDLTKLDEKEFKSIDDLLKHIVQPSLRIEDKYRTNTFNLESGGAITGMILERTKEGDYKVIENPLAKAEAKLVKKADLDGAPKASDVSMMPKGLLDKMTKDEILDLLGYVWSKHDPKFRYFKGGDGHGGGHGHP